MQEYLITLLVKIGVAAAIASFGVRSNAVRRMLQREERTLAQRISLALWFIALFLPGVAIRIVTRTNYSALDLGLEGSLLAGIRIGTMIRAKNFATVVPEGTQCASACAIAWLGGTPRLVEERASVGFHAAYIVKAGGPIESGPGNAILGAYLNQLGLSEKAILYITHAGPTTIHWMNMGEAAEYGIQ